MNSLFSQIISYINGFINNLQPYQFLLFGIIVFILPYYFLAKYHLWEKFKIKLTPVFVILFLSVSLAPSVVISIYGYNQSKLVIVQEAKSYIKNVSNTLANNISVFFNKRVNEIEYLGNVFSIPAGIDLETTLKEFQQKEPSYKLLGFLDPAGRPVAMSSKKWAGLDFSKMDYFREAIKGTGIYFSSPIIDTLDHQPELVISQPMRNLKTRKLIGVVFGVIDLHKVGEITYYAIRRSSKENKYMFVTVLDKSGLLLFDNGTLSPKFLKERLSDNEVYQKVKRGEMLKKQEQRSQERSKDNEKKAEDADFVIEGKIPISHEYGYVGGLQIGTDHRQEYNNWVILVSIPETNVLEGLQQVKVKFIIVLIAIVIFIPFFAVSLSRGFLEPIHELHRGSEVIGEGNLEHRIKIKTGNELQALAEQFNSMAANLNNSYARLEEKVRERTSQLQDRNQELQKIQDYLVVKNEELSDAYIRLERLDIMKDEFVSTVSHELRTPLTAIKEGVSLIMDRVLPGELTPEQERVLLIAKKNIGRLETLIQDILDLAKLESGTMKLQRKELPVKQVIEGFIPTMQPLAEHKKLELTYQLADNLPSIYADETRIVQILTNLVGNAVKFTDSGGRIRVSARPVENEEMVEFAVEDNGKGIPKDAQERIFEKFEQVDREIKPGVKGTGLGLSICKQIVEQHGGKIGVASVLNQGSVFSFTVPAFKSGALLTVGFKQMLNDYSLRQEPFTVVVILIKNFLQIKERYGEYWGRILIDDIAQVLHEKVRREDLLIKGDDGSMVMIIKAADGNLPQFNDKLAKLVAGQTHFHEQEEVKVELVAGQATCPEDGTEQDLLLAKARERARGV